ncbi:CBN-MRE-11 protein [Caenorhabditis brenneri]|uniref:Double-strand break repair protein n=1 Tax=Caenorhabditis brenneri TaxID=135651 RepID=G0N8R9_CAEBE|nr:CBN-MRE-11 protein [Caenorhabditis brenneri]
MCGSDDSFEDFVIDSQEPTTSSRRQRSQSTDDSVVPCSQRPDAAHDTMVENIDEEENREHGESDDVIRILVATDIHCGYGENKPNIHMDAVNTFEEVLQIATDQKVDMVLLGGDLYHENNPSREVQHRVTQLLRQYCLNENPIAMEFLSDASVNFNQSVFDHVNYYDQNLNIGLPVFTIHGNHDDLSGKGLTALDLLHEAGLVNLFGKHSTIEEFIISPILLRKGETRLALYGLGSQRDDRLVRAFKDETISFLRPNAGAEDWFNLFVLHQNRPRRAVHRTTGNFLPETLIPQFFDLLVWGHEHECKPEPQYVASSDAAGDGFYILQPGSTVATSLTPEEALQKNVFLIKIKGRRFASKPIPLQTVRPMVCDELVLDKIPPGCRPVTRTERPKNRDGRYIDEIAIEAKLNEMIARATSGRGPRQPELPLIRLKVIYDGDWINVLPANAKRIGLRYENTVANAVDMVTIKKVSSNQAKEKKMKDDETQFKDELGHVSAANLQTIINDYFINQPIAEQLTVLKPFGIGKALDQYSEIEEGGTAASANRNFDQCLLNQIDVVRSTLKKMPLPAIDNVSDLEKFHDLIVKDLYDLKKADCEKSRDTTAVAEHNEDDDRQFYMPEGQITSRTIDEEDYEDEVLNSDEEPMRSYSKFSKPPNSRGRGRGSRGRSTRGSSRGTTRGKSSQVVSRQRADSDEDGFILINDSPPPPPTSRASRGNSRGKTTAAKKRDLSFF